MNNKKISLCIITKNELNKLQKKLALTKSYFYETLIVDTGSNDGTIEFAKSIDCKVFSFNWIDDFSAARNFGIKHCSGDYIFMLDSDEEIENPEIIQEFVDSIKDNVGGILVKTTSIAKNANGESKFVEFLPRLFKNSPNIKYNGRVHEQILSSIKSNGLKLKASDIQIIHDGYNLDNNELEQKLQRNLKLLNLEIQENNGDSLLLYHRAKTYHQLGNLKLALSDIEKAIKISSEKSLFYVKLLNLYSKLLLSNGNLDTAYQKALESIDKFQMQTQPFQIITDISIIRKNYVAAINSISAIMTIVKNPTDVTLLLGDYQPNLDKLQELKQKCMNALKGKNQLLQKANDKDTRASLSLCMIVKNEEKHLPGCLESVKSLVDEIIVVDTGSDDRTVEIARSYGAKVHHFKWIDDFAAARNESIKYATKDWIIYLDADERIESKYHSLLKDAISEAGDEVGGIAVVISSEHLKLDNSTEKHKGMYPRIFRNYGYPKIKFQGRVHEQITPSIFELCKSVVKRNIEIEHIGYDISREEMNEKVQRNYKLLIRHVNEEPTNGYAWFQLGQTLGQMRLNKEAEEAIRFAINCGNLSDMIYASAAASLAQFTGNQKKFDEALDWAEKSLEKAPDQLYAMHIKAFALMYLGRYDEAEKFFKISLNRIEDKERLPQSGFDIEIPKDIILKGIAKLESLKKLK